jgi:Predicted ATPase
MEHFNPSHFRIGGGAEITAFRELPNENKFTPFPRTRLRARLMEAQHVEWPEKTRDIYRYRCAFNYSRLAWPTRIWNKLRIHRHLASKTVEWDFLDFPGERLSDSLIEKHKNFADWSDELIELWQSYDRLREAMAEYLGVMAQPTATDHMLLSAYKRCLAKMVHGKFQIITPSTFMLAHGGKNDVFGYADIEDGGQNRIVGLPEKEFTPLSSAARQARGENDPLAPRFAAHYQLYRNHVVRPLFDAVNVCDRLLVLVDIPGILSGGVGRYNDTNHLIETLADNLTPSNWFFTNVDKAAFIATKSDMVHRRDQDNLKALVDDMMRIARNRQPRISYSSFIASAWVSAESVDLSDGGRALRGIPARDKEIRTFHVPELGPEWPADWGPEEAQYSYPLLSPPRLANRYMAPEQRNLDRIFDFLIS